MMIKFDKDMFFLPAVTLWGLTFAATWLIVAQTLVYFLVQGWDVVYEGPCTVQINEEKSGMRGRMVATCGDYSADVFDYEDLILYMKNPDMPMICTITKGSMDNHLRQSCQQSDVTDTVL
jgi:hypothetical protein